MTKAFMLNDVRVPATAIIEFSPNGRGSDKTVWNVVSIGGRVYTLNLLAGTYAETNKKTISEMHLYFNLPDPNSVAKINNV